VTIHGIAELVPQHVPAVADREGFPVHQVDRREILQEQEILGHRDHSE
jgi:hypothetical protein